MTKLSAMSRSCRLCRNPTGTNNTLCRTCTQATRIHIDYWTSRPPIRYLCLTCRQKYVPAPGEVCGDCLETASFIQEVF